MAVPSELHWASKPLVVKGSGFGPQMLDLYPGCGQTTHPVTVDDLPTYLSQGLTLQFFLYRNESVQALIN